MLLCRLARRTLHHSHNHLASPAICTSRRTWLPASRSYSSPSGEGRQDEELDLSSLSADSAYLDFLLGPTETPSASYVEKDVKGAAETVSDGPISSPTTLDGITSLQTRRQRRREQIKLADQAARRRRAPLTYYDSDQPQSVGYEAETRGKVQEVSQWNLGGDGKAIATISVKRIVPAIAPARQISGVRYRQLKIQPHQRYNARYRAWAMQSAAQTRRHAKRPVRKHQRLQTQISGIGYRKLEIVSAEDSGLRAEGNVSNIPALAAKPLKSMKVPHPVRSQSFSWRQEFRKMRRAFDTRSRQRGSALSSPKLHPDAGAWAKSALTSQTHRQMRQCIVHPASHVVNMEHLWYWQQAALWILYHEPDRIVDFLLATRWWVPRTYLQDILQYLADRSTFAQDGPSTMMLAALANAFPRLANRGTRRPLFVRSSFFRLLMPHCSQQQINELYRAIRDYKVELSWLTLLHFATRLARTGQFEQALEAIIESSRAGAEHDSFAFRSTCATLLRTAIQQPSGLRVCLRVIDNFVKLGLTLNIQLCNIVMLNAVEAGDQKTAFAVYNSLVPHGLRADAYTYAILLKGCKAAIDDADALNTTIRDAIEHIGVAHEPVVATEIIHCLALHHSKHNPGRAFDTIVDAYAQLFDLEPLRKLGIAFPQLTARIRLDADRMQPPEHVVEIMMAAYLEHTSVQTRSPASAYAMYRRFRELADAGVQPFRSLVQTDYAANAFMMTFGKTKKGLLHAAEVIKDMQREKVECCRPTVQTWTIFLHSFTRHGQMKLSEQVLSYMKSKDMTPNQVTWNVLTAGYATAQDVEGTRGALRRMEEDGKVWDRWTEGGVKNLKDQRALTQLQYTRRLQMDVDADLKKSLSNRISSLEEDKVEQRQVDHGDGMADSPGDLAEPEEVVDTVYKPL